MQNMLISTTTKNLINDINLDLMPNMPTQVDFGMMPSADSTKVFGALQYGYRRGHFTAQELNSALGNGKALTKLVDRPDNAYGHNIVIKTAWDNVHEEEDEYHVERERTREQATADREEL